MKKLSIEEKARRYDEAIEIAKDINNEQRAQPFNVMTRVFPELAESEDERIRKEMIEIIKNEAHEFPSSIIAEKSKSWIAWLKKQEQKPVKTPQWMIDFLNEHRSNFGHAVDHDERRDIEGKLLCIKQWLEGNPNIEQKPAEWSEEDKRIIDNLISQLGNLYARKLIKEETKDKYVNWLKSLRPQKQDVMSVDEFRHIVGYLVQDIVANEHMPETEKKPTNFFVEKYYNKLSSQSHWRPSDDQMEAVRLAAEIGTANNSWAMGILKGMYQDLKKLREEQL